MPTGAQDIEEAHRQVRWLVALIHLIVVIGCVLAIHISLVSVLFAVTLPFSLHHVYKVHSSISEYVDLLPNPDSELVRVRRYSLGLVLVVGGGLLFNVFLVINHYLIG